MKDHVSETYLPILDWETDSREESNDFDINSEEFVKKNILEGYQTAYQIFFGEKRSEIENEKTEQDFGNELIHYLKNLYYEPPTKKSSRVLYTTTRLFGYVSPFVLQSELSSYQDTYGRTGGNIMLQNVKKILFMKQKQAILAKLQANVRPKK